MDINCTYGCVHQNDGKCSFINSPTSLTLGASIADTNSTNEANCPYFCTKKKNAL